MANDYPHHSLPRHNPKHIKLYNIFEIYFIIFKYCVSISNGEPICAAPVNGVSLQGCKQAKKTGLEHGTALPGFNVTELIH